MNLIYNKNKQGKIDFISTIKRSYCPLSLLPLAYLAYMGMCCWFRVVTISSFRVLNRVSVWAVEVDEEQSIVTFLVPPFFPQVFSMFLSLKANLIVYAKWNESELQNEVSWLKEGREINNVSYYQYSLSVQAQGGDLTF